MKEIHALDKQIIVTQLYGQINFDFVASADNQAELKILCEDHWEEIQKECGKFKSDFEE